MSERQMRFRIGLLVFVAMGLFAALVVLFGSLPTVFKRTNPYTIVFSDAPGVATGVPVRRSGVRIGEVRDLKIDEETGKVHVVVSIDPPYRVRHNEVPTLVVGLLTSDVAIDLVPEVPPPPM